MVKDAESHAAEDKRKRELVEARNHGEGLAHSTERTLSESADKIAAADKQAAEAAIAALREVLTSEDVEAIKAKTDALTQVSMKIGEAIYKAAQAEGVQPGAGPEAGAATAESGEDGAKVVDADFEEVDERKKSN
jgi:molecular chaperone DnaK